LVAVPEVVVYGAFMVDAPRRPEESIGLHAPDIALPLPDRSRFSLRSRVGRGPLLLFFYIKNGTPG
jgi:hypothetical protein